MAMTNSDSYYTGLQQSPDWGFWDDHSFHYSLELKCHIAMEHLKYGWTKSKCALSIKCIPDFQTLSAKVTKKMEQIS